MQAGQEACAALVRLVRDRLGCDGPGSGRHPQDEAALADLARALENRNSRLGKLNVRYHIQDRLTKLLTSGSGSLADPAGQPGISGLLDQD